MFYIDFGEKPNKWDILAEKLSISILNFPKATGLKTDLGKQEELDDFHTNKSS
jgi:hypothetical protein